MPAPELPSGIYGVCDDSLRPDWTLEEKAARLLDGGIRVLQLRMKGTPLRRAVEAARSVSAHCRQAGALCLVNDRVDLALLSGAHGVHLGDEDLPVEDARALLGPDAVIGATCRTADAISRAKQAGASYAGVGPVFRTATKQVDARLLGSEGLARLLETAALPVVAIAGIQLANVGEVAACGVRMAAVVSDLLLAPDPAVQARLLAAEFERGRARRTLGATP
jgi:thiamine-phosphate pyrophosphorylase